MVARKRPAAGGQGPEAKHATKTNPSNKKVTFVFAAGASGGRSRQNLLQEFGDVHEVHFSGAPNLTSVERETPFLEQLIAAAQKAVSKTPTRPFFFVGHSFGARASVHLMARKDLRRQLPKNCHGIIAFGYPLVHPSQHRERKLLELPASCKVLFISGTKDPFAGDFKLFEKTLSKTKFQSPLVKVDGGDHGLKCPKQLEEGAVSTIREALRRFI
mmetsp:Transcript_1418/g.3620  ORF Transcript_1418/g.3620 Transcript_1418/m.3620 type:complete len:215 (-) Transcript_1418:48-692(-)